MPARELNWAMREQGSELTPKKARINPQNNRLYHILGDTPEKQKQRELVRQHIQKHLRQKELRMFSLPGEHWLLENQLADDYPESRFVACEYDTVTMERSVRHMPGSRTKRINQYWIEEEQKHLDFWSTDNATLIGVDAWRFWQGMTPTHWKYPEGYQYRFGRTNALWIDPFGPLGSSRYLQILRGIGRHAAKQRVVCAFSFLLGRDDSQLMAAFRLCPGKTPLVKRANFIQEVLWSEGCFFQQTDLHQHRSFNSQGSATMGTVFGIASPNFSK